MQPWGTLLVFTPLFTAKCVPLCTLISLVLRRLKLNSPQLKHSRRSKNTFLEFVASFCYRKPQIIVTHFNLMRFESVPQILLIGVHVYVRAHVYTLDVWDGAKMCNISDTLNITAMHSGQESSTRTRAYWASRRAASCRRQTAPQRFPALNSAFFFFLRTARSARFCTYLKRNRKSAYTVLPFEWNNTPQGQEEEVTVCV